MTIDPDDDEAKANRAFNAGYDTDGLSRVIRAIEESFAGRGPEVRAFRSRDGKRFKARAMVATIDERARWVSVLIDPVLPVRFDDTDNERRPASHQRWWHRPYIQTETVEHLDQIYAERNDAHAEQARAYWQKEGRPKWLEAFPRGTRWMVRCLDGGAWDRSSQWGTFGSLAEALECVGEGPFWNR